MSCIGVFSQKGFLEMPYSVTNASVHDSQKCTDLLEESDKAVFADSAYSSEE